MKTASASKIEKRLENLKAWVVRIKGVLAALEGGNMEPAKELARESIEKNNRMIQEIEKFIAERRAAAKA